jgi:hypothetical protein
MDTISKNNPGKVGKVAKFPSMQPGNGLSGNFETSYLLVSSLPWRFFQFPLGTRSTLDSRSTAKILWQTFDKVGKVHCSRLESLIQPRSICLFWPFLHVLPLFPRSFQVPSAQYFSNVRGRLWQSSPLAISTLESDKNGSSTLFSMVFSSQRSHPKGQLCHFANFATLLFQNSGLALLFISVQPGLPLAYFAKPHFSISQLLPQQSSTCSNNSQLSIHFFQLETRSIYETTN